MKAFVLATALCLSACATTPPIDLLPAVAAAADRVLPAPETIANRTVADEQAAIGVELAYKAFRTALELGVDAGVITGPRARLAADADNRAYAAVQAMRAAYRGANAGGTLAAAAEARTAIAQALLALKGRS